MASNLRSEFRWLLGTALKTRGPASPSPMFPGSRTKAAGAAPARGHADGRTQTQSAGSKTRVGSGAGGHCGAREGGHRDRPPALWDRTLETLRLGSSRQQRMSREPAREPGAGTRGQRGFTQPAPHAGGGEQGRSGQKGQQTRGCRAGRGASSRTEPSSALSALGRHGREDWKVSAGRGTWEGVSDHGNTR